MTAKKQSIKKGGRKGKAAGSKELSETDWLTGERVRIILSDPQAPRRVKSKLEELTYRLYAETNSFSEVTPDSCAADFINGTASLIVTPDEDARAVHDEIVRLAEANEPEEYRIARRVAELYAAEVSKPGEGEGRQLLMEAADAVTTEGGEGVMLKSPLSEFFPTFFVKAVRDLSRDHHAYVAVKELVARADAGEDLDQVAEAQERGGEERRAAQKAAELAKPEPKDKTSDEWRYWQLRHIEAGFAADNTEEYGAAWRAFWRYFDGFKREPNAATVETARGILPGLIIAFQRAEGYRQSDRRSEAAKRGAETRKKKAAKKGGE